MAWRPLGTPSSTFCSGGILAFLCDELAANSEIFKKQTTKIICQPTSMARALVLPTGGQLVTASVHKAGL